ncbi:MAG TPA: acyltransferase [Mycobacteriales bacterium]|jgi:peptidoglycan/LPS O-acetylase OafA/YrhL|nr:acyltransferase [Mycobacteriales bacterium]
MIAAAQPRRAANSAVRALLHRAVGGTFANRLDPKANSLNAIRLVLAATVIVSHSWPIGRYGRTPTHGGFAPGGWAVDTFFVLSGYLITGSRLNNSFESYLKRRILRIYPGFVVCLFSVVVVFAPIGYLHLHHTLWGYASSVHTPLNYLLANLDLKMHLPSVAGTPGGGQAWAGTLWTLYFEFLCYLIVGVLACWATFRHRPILAVLVLAATTAISFQNHHVDHQTDSANLVRLLPFFLAGSVIYLLRDRIPCTWWLAIGSLAAVVFVPNAGPQFVVICALPITYLVLYLGAVVPIALGRRNDISYGLYMYGYPVEQVIRYFHPSSQAVFITVSIAATVPLATASWFFIERPAMRWRTTKARAPRVGDVRPGRAVEATEPVTANPAP